MNDDRKLIGKVGTKSIFVAKFAIRIELSTQDLTLSTCFIREHYKTSPNPKNFANRRYFVSSKLPSKCFFNSRLVHFMDQFEGSCISSRARHKCLTPIPTDYSLNAGLTHTRVPSLNEGAGKVTKSMRQGVSFNKPKFSCSGLMKSCAGSKPNGSGAFLKSSQTRRFSPGSVIHAALQSA